MNELDGWTLVASAGYLLPLLALALVLQREDDDGIDVAAKLGTLFAADLLGTFALALAMTIERAAFVRTCVMTLASVGVALWRRRRREDVTTRRRLLNAGVPLAGAAGAVAFLINHGFSSKYWIWDSCWHVPFTASLRAQSLPIENVYEPGRHFRYHMVGDVAGAVLQSLSGAAMNAARSLAYAHDLMAVVLVSMIALLLRATTSWSRGAAIVLAQIPLFAGPLGLRHHPDEGLGNFEGYADFNNLTLSFRPHCIVALVLIIGLFAHLLRWSRLHTDGKAPTVAMLATTAPLLALLGITDEISGFTLGVALGVLWLVWPRLFGARRWYGPAFLAMFTLLALVANQLLAGTLARGGPVSHAELLAPRLPRFFADGLPLGSKSEAWIELFIDVSPIVIPLAVASVSVLRGFRRPDPLRVPTVLTVVVCTVSLALFLCFEVNGRTFEGHRFMTAARLLTPLLALLVLPRVTSTSLTRLAIVGPIAGGVFATLGFFYTRMPEYGDSYAQTRSQYGANCRTEYRARLGERMLPTWVDQPIWYEYAGCRPIFAAPDSPPGDVVLVGWPAVGHSAFLKMDDHFFPKGRSARMVCPKDPADRSELCRAVTKLAKCRDQGSKAILCVVPAELRAKVRHL